MRDLVYLAKGNELTVVANLLTYIRSKEREEGRKELLAHSDE